MRILITGATGFIGCELLPLLASRHEEDSVLCCVRNIEKAHALLYDLERLHFCHVDDEGAIKCFDPEIVLHLAAYNTSRESTSDIERLVDSNIEFGLKLLNTLQSCLSFRLFVNTGSFSQYAQDGDVYLYSASKSAFEVFLKYYCRKNSWKYINVVPYSVYGGGKTVKRIFDYIADSIDSQSPVKMSPGLQELDFVHVSDVAKFYVDAIENINELYDGFSYHIGTGTATSIRNVVKMVESLCHKTCNIEWGGIEYRNNDIMYACAPQQPERDKIWVPTYDLKTGIVNFFC